MIRWNSGSEFGSLHGAMDRLYEDIFGPSQGQTGPRTQTPTYVLPLDIREVESGYEIQAPVPGFKPDEVDITFSEGVLKVLAQRSSEVMSNQGGFLRREVARGHYQRSIQLPGDIREADISAHFEHGMLTISVPKAPKPQPRRIHIQTDGVTVGSTAAEVTDGEATADRSQVNAVGATS